MRRRVGCGHRPPRDAVRRFGTQAAVRRCGTDAREGVVDGGSPAGAGAAMIRGWAGRGCRWWVGTERPTSSVVRWPRPAAAPGRWSSSRARPAWARRRSCTGCWWTTPPTRRPCSWGCARRRRRPRRCGPGSRRSAPGRGCSAPTAPRVRRASGHRRPPPPARPPPAPRCPPPRLRLPGSSGTAPWAPSPRSSSGGRWPGPTRCCPAWPGALPPCSCSRTGTGPTPRAARCWPRSRRGAGRCPCSSSSRPARTLAPRPCCGSRPSATPGCARSTGRASAAGSGPRAARRRSRTSSGPSRPATACRSCWPSATRAGPGSRRSAPRPPRVSRRSGCPSSPRPPSCARCTTRSSSARSPACPPRPSPRRWTTPGAPGSWSATGSATTWCATRWPASARTTPRGCAGRGRSTCGGAATPRRPGWSSSGRGPATTRSARPGGPGRRWTPRRRPGPPSPWTTPARCWAARSGRRCWPRTPCWARRSPWRRRRSPSTSARCTRASRSARRRPTPRHGRGGATCSPARPWSAARSCSPGRATPSSAWPCGRSPWTPRPRCGRGCCPSWPRSRPTTRTSRGRGSSPAGPCTWRRPPGTPPPCSTPTGPRRPSSRRGPRPVASGCAWGTARSSRRCGWGSPWPPPSATAGAWWAGWSWPGPTWSTTR